MQQGLSMFLCPAHIVSIQAVALYRKLESFEKEYALPTINQLVRQGRRSRMADDKSKTLPYPAGTTPEARRVHRVFTHDPQEAELGSS